MMVKLWLLLVAFMNLVILMTCFYAPYASSLQYRWAKVLLNSFFVSLLAINLESVLACWLVIACIVVKIG